jgi:hypothetical protein
MNAILSPAATACYPPDRDAGLRTCQASRADLAVVSLTRQMDIELVTAEGDKVTLSVDSRAAGLHAAFEDIRTDGSGAMAYNKSELTMGLYQREMSLTVEGDLSAAERRDINKVLKTLDKMMNRFVNGKLRPAAAQARKLQGLNTIADLTVHISTESRTLTATRSQATATYDRLGMPSAPQAEIPESSISIPAAEADSVADAMAEEIQSAPTPVRRMMPFVNQLLDDYRRQMADLNRFGTQIMDRIENRLSRVLAESTADA